MALTKIDQADTTNMSGTVTDITPDFAQDTGPSEVGETIYQADWTKWLGYYHDVDEIASIIKRQAQWVIGAGFTADAKTTKRLNSIRGFGKDNFNTICFNNLTVRDIAGDSYAEIIRDKAGRLINLKPLNPGTLRIIADKFGLITRYEQGTNGKSDFKRFNIKKIFHLTLNREADEIHGRSSIEAMQQVIDMRNESMQDLKIVFHRYVKPLLITEADTDDDGEIAALRVKLDNMVEKGENLIIPKGTVAMTRMSIPQFSTLDPLPYIQYLEKSYLMNKGIPALILGRAEDTTEAASKILLMAWKRVVEWDQMILKTELKNQLGVEVNFPKPPDLEPEMKADNKKDGNLRLKDVKRKN